MLIEAVADVKAGQPPLFGLVETPERVLEAEPETEWYRVRSPRRTSTDRSSPALAAVLHFSHPIRGNLARKVA